MAQEDPARRLRTLMQNIFTQEDDPRLVVQRARWGSALKQALPLGPKEDVQPIPVDFFFLRASELHEKEDAETEAFKEMVLQDFINTQNEHVYGLAHASGSGKTRLAFALGTQEAHAVLIRLSFGDTPAPAFEMLTTTLLTIYQSLTGYCNVHGLNDKSPPGVVSSHLVALNHYAQVALDAVRIFIFAHLEWLLIVDNESRDLFNGNVDRQRRVWLQALENGVGSKATSVIFHKRALELLSLEIPAVGVQPEQLTPVKQYCALMDQQLRSQMLGGPAGRVIIAFDEIGAAKKLFPGLWYQFGHFGKHESFRLQEVFTRLPSDTYREPADLYLAFVVLIRTLRDRYKYRSILMDTNFSLFDIEDMMKRSPMRGNLKACTSGLFHRMTTCDMYALVKRYFEVPAVMPEELKTELAIFEGRPLYFVEHAFPDFLSLCASRKPGSPNDVVACLLDAVKIAVPKTVEFFEQRVAKAWNNTRAPVAAGSPTVSTSLASLDAMLRLDISLKDKVELTEEQVRDLSATGMIFGHQRGDKGKLTYQPCQEPLTLLTIQRFTNQKLNRPQTPLSQRDDHVWNYLFRFWNDPNRTGGHHYETMVAWLFVHAQLNLDENCTLTQFLEETGVKPAGFVIPSRFNHLLVATTAMEDMQQEPPRFRQGLLFPASGIQYNIDNDARPDILVPLITSSGEQAVCAIQAKSGDSSTLTGALSSVTPACAYLVKNLKALQALLEQLPLLGDDLNLKRDSLAAKKAENRARFDEALMLNGLEQRWLRAVCRIQPYHKDELDKINIHNERVDADPTRFDFILPLSFLQPSDAKPLAHSSLDDWILRSWTIDQRNHALSALPNPLSNNTGISFLAQRLRTVNPAGLAELVQSLSPEDIARLVIAFTQQQQ